MTIAFDTVDIPDVSDLPRDSIPDVVDVEYPCRVCGREAGPYGGRGPKPKVCGECKPKRVGKAGTPKISGTSANLAAQATQVLCQLNGFVALGLSAIGMFQTAGAIAAYDDTFKEQAYSALVTDPELCKYLLRGGVKSAKVALVLAYGGMGVAVAPHAVAEIRQKKAEREAARLAEEEVTN